MDLTREEYRYDLEDLADPTQGVGSYAGHPPECWAPVDAAVAAPANETVVEGDLGPALDADGGSSVLRYRGGYHCLEIDGDDVRSGGAVAVESDCHCLDVSGPVVHRFEALSSAAQTAVRSALRDDDRSVWLTGDRLPEFRSGGDAPRLATGIYYVRYQGTVYELSVTSKSGVGAGIAAYFLTLIAVGGLVLAVVGGEALYRGRVRRPVAVLSWVAVTAALLVLPIPGFGTSEFLTMQLLVGLVAGVGVWVVLRWRGVG